MKYQKGGVFAEIMCWLGILIVIAFIAYGAGKEDSPEYPQPDLMYRTLQTECKGYDLEKYRVWICDNGSMYIDETKTKFPPVE